jgi:uncharacterized protein YndB with AHSA1/START domain
MTEPLVVRRETQIAASPATVFAFLTDPDKILSRWIAVWRCRRGSFIVKTPVETRSLAHLLFTRVLVSE